MTSKSPLRQKEDLSDTLFRQALSRHRCTLRIPRFRPAGQCISPMDKRQELHSVHERRRRPAHGPDILRRSVRGQSNESALLRPFLAWEGGGDGVTRISDGDLANMAEACGNHSVELLIANLFSV
jgi:hypothetical protein